MFRKNTIQLFLCTSDGAFLAGYYFKITRKLYVHFPSTTCNLLLLTYFLTVFLLGDTPLRQSQGPHASGPRPGVDQGGPHLPFS